MVGASAFAATSADKVTADITSLYVKGLVMLDLGNPDVVRLGFPKAPGHKATLSIVPQNGTRRTMAIKGNGSVEATEIASADPKIFVPELVRMKEFYGNSVKSHVDKCPSVISIPCNAIRSIKTSEVSQARYTFVRADNGEEVTSFRPRQVAETIKIDLSSTGTLKLDDGKVNIPLEGARELRVEYTAEKIEPGFAMAFWGEAMTFNHPLWMEQDREAARKALERLAPTKEARQTKATTKREKMYLEAVEALYAPGDKALNDIWQSCAPRTCDRLPRRR